MSRFRKPNNIQILAKKVAKNDQGSEIDIAEKNLRNFMIFTTTNSSLILSEPIPQVGRER